MFVLLLFCLSCFFLSNHPISSTLSLIFSSMIIIFSCSSMLKNSWFSMIFMLMLIGGLIILFIYMASLSSNEALSINPSQSTKIFLSLVFILPSPNPPYLSSNMYNINSIFSSLSNLNNIVALLILFFYLILIIEIISFSKSPFRSMI
uniref:NADH dehydrogenase subunit 6 n=1 Tax=Coleolaelaps cf. liui XFX-2019 TaxID=2695870 RepID=A0A6B9WG24_9ACAR|nr:NADH dehydrogenase subunit 6 [Coleolaelaps cf. liui XFX-2019]